MVDNGTTEGVIRCCTTEIPLYFMLSQEKPLSVQGHYALFAYSILQKFNYSYEVLVTDDSMDYGNVYGERNGTGTLGYLMRNESDVVLTLITITLENFRYLDFTNPVLVDEWQIVSSNKLIKFEFFFFAMISILSRQLWVAFISTLFGVSVAWSFLDYLSSKLIDEEEVEFVLEPFSLTRKFFTSYKIAICQAIGYPSHVVSRLPLMSWMITCLVIRAGFNSFLLSKVTHPPKPIRIDSGKDLLDYPNMPFLVFTNSYPHHALKSSTDKVGKQLWERVQGMGTLKNPADMNLEIEVIKLKDSVQVSTLPRHVIVEGSKLALDCNAYGGSLYLSQEALYNSYLGFPIRRDLRSDYKKIVKRTAQNLYETGIILYSLHLECWKCAKCFYNHDKIPELKVLDTDAFVVPFYVYCVGHGVALAIFVVQLYLTTKVSNRLLYGNRLIQSTKLKHKNLVKLYKIAFES